MIPPQPDQMRKSENIEKVKLKDTYCVALRRAAIGVLRFIGRPLNRGLRSSGLNGNLYIDKSDFHVLCHKFPLLNCRRCLYHKLWQPFFTEVNSGLPLPV